MRQQEKIDQLIKASKSTNLNSLPEMTVHNLYQIGLALEAGMTREEMIETWGKETIAWLEKAEQDIKFQEFIKEGKALGWGEN